VTDHLVDGANFRDVLYAIVLVAVLAALTWGVRQCSTLGLWNNLMDRVEGAH
jgi:hypothetical protein